MAIVFNSDAGTISGLSVGGLPDGIVDGDMLAANSITAGKIADGTISNADINDLAASKLTGALPAISGASLTGITTGKVLQVVTDTGSTTNLTATTTESDIGLSLNITPQTGSSILLLTTCKYHLVNNQGAYWRGYFFKDSTNIGQAFYVFQDQDGSNTDETAVGQKLYTDSAFNGSTSFAFSVRISQTNGYCRHGHSGTTTLTAIEIGA